MHVFHVLILKKMTKGGQLVAFLFEVGVLWSVSVVLEHSRLMTFAFLLRKISILTGKKQTSYLW